MCRRRGERLSSQQCVLEPVVVCSGLLEAEKCPLAPLQSERLQQRRHSVGPFVDPATGLEGRCKPCQRQPANADVGTEEDSSTYYGLHVVLLYIHICPCGCEDVCRWCILWSRLLRWTAGVPWSRAGTGHRPPRRSTDRVPCVPCETRDAARVCGLSCVERRDERVLGGGK